jgi:hypothetical protein
MPVEDLSDVEPATMPILIDTGVCRMLQTASVHSDTNGSCGPTLSLVRNKRATPRACPSRA